MISISDKRRIFGSDIDSIDNNSRRLTVSTHHFFQPWALPRMNPGRVAV
jgi:hypothetical protein